MVIKVLLDSDILIDYLRAQKGPLPDLIDQQKHGICELSISAVSVMEIFTGKSAGKISNELESFIASFRVIPFGKRIARFAGEIKRKYKPNLPAADYIIGITALWLKTQLATRNKKHFQGIPSLIFFDLPKKL